MNDNEKLIEELNSLNNYFVEIELYYAANLIEKAIDAIYKLTKEKKK